VQQSACEYLSFMPSILLQAAFESTPKPNQVRVCAPIAPSNPPAPC